jgi:hypothetical protein
MRIAIAIGLGLELGAVALPTIARAEGSVSNYLRAGWEIKAASQMSSMGYTQIVLQKGTQGVVCTIYYSVTENGWTAKGCDSLP